MTTAELLDSSAVRAFGYLFAGIVSVGAARREVARPSHVTWPTFWYVTAAVFLASALGRAIGIDDLLTDLGRDRARAEGWYDARRGVQAAVAGAVAITWVVVVFSSIWRVPARRRPYLPPALAAFTLGCFGAGRLVSLHHVDALLYRRSIAGVRVVALAEWSLLGLMIVTIAWSLRATAARSVLNVEDARAQAGVPPERAVSSRR